jgi:phosphinothricin acetyltransferase
MELTLRPGRREDLEGILAIYNHYVSTTAATFDTVPVSAEDREVWLRDHSQGRRHRLFVAVGPGGDLQGWATTGPFRPRPGYATTVESSVYCHPARIGQGIGSRLYEALFASIAHEDVERIVAGVALPNPPSVSLHLRFGFRHVGTFTRIGRKLGQYWDVAWFERSLVASPLLTGGSP